MLSGISRNDDILILESFNPLSIKITDVERYLLYYSIESSIDKLPVYSTEVKESVEEYRRKEKLLLNFEKRWRLDKSLALSREEQEASNKLHLCKIGSYNIYGMLIHKTGEDFLLQLEALGEVSISTNIWSQDRQKDSLLLELRNLLL